MIVLSRALVNLPPLRKLSSPFPYQGEGDTGDRVDKQFQTAQVEAHPSISYTVSCYNMNDNSSSGEVMLAMVRSYTAKYTKISSGYMGQLVEWPEVITEGKTIEECREMLRDALQEMLLAYKQQGKEIPLGGDLLEQMLVEA